MLTEQWSEKLCQVSHHCQEKVHKAVSKDWKQTLKEGLTVGKRQYELRVCKYIKAERFGFTFPSSTISLASVIAL